MNNVLLAIVILLFSLTPFSAAAQNIPPEKLARQVQQTYDQMASLRFHFSQQTSGEMTGRPQRGEGWAAFLRKDNERKMRWQYEPPNTQVILNDGQNLLMYFQNLQQMIISSADQLATDLTYAFFIGQGDLTNDFKLLPADEAFQSSDVDNKLQAIRLVPRTPQQQVAEIELFIDQNNLIAKIVIEDHFGTVTTLYLSNIEINALEDSSPEDIQTLFSFTPPPGTEIIKQ